MGAARIHRDVAGDGAGKLARRIRGIEEAVAFHRAGDGKVGTPRLDPDEAVVVIRLQHGVQPRDAEDHAVGRRHRAAGERGAGAARHDRHAEIVADLQRRRHLCRRAWQDRRQGRAAIGGKRIAFIGARLGLVVDHRVGGQDRPQGRHDFGFVRHDPRIGRRHPHDIPLVW